MTANTATTALNGIVSCADSDFMATAPPMADEESCTQEADSDTVESVRSCPGEPYHADFFTFDSVTKVYYKRHKVLFNLYNWDEQRSYTPTSRASLTLENCQFTYFLAGYESLINVETNNLSVIKPTTVGSKQYIETLGHDRGVKITITGSSFSHSRFCKGMLVYKKRPYLESTFDYLVYGLSTSNSLAAETADNSMIKIASSTFTNLNFGKVLLTLSLLDERTLPI